MNKTKGAIVESAIKVFSSEGYKGATMDEIALKAGVAKGTLYYNFNSKEEIFNYIIQLGIEHLREKIKITKESKLDPVTKLNDICIIQLTYFNENKDFVKVILSQLWGTEERQNILRDTIKLYIDDIKEILDEAIKDKIIDNKNSSILSHLLFGSITSTAIYDLIDNEKEDLEVVTKVAVEFSLKGIGVPII